MLTLRKATDRGHADHGWLKTYHTFSFADYHDPDHMGFRSLRVINDDLVAPGAGFGTHPHRDMEIITYVLEGELEHKDSMGNGRIIRAGEIQYMAAGTGVTHSEFNPSSTQPVHLLQIWILPDHPGAQPKYGEKSLADAKTDRLHLITSRTGRDHSLQTNQDADLYLARLEVNRPVVHLLRPNRHAWVHVAEGELRLNDITLQSGDAAAISDESALELAATRPTQVLLFDLN